MKDFPQMTPGNIENSLDADRAFEAARQMNFCMTTEVRNVVMCAAALAREGWVRKTRFELIRDGILKAYMAAPNALHMRMVEDAIRNGMELAREQDGLDKQPGCAVGGSDMPHKGSPEHGAMMAECRDVLMKMVVP